MEAEQHAEFVEAALPHLSVVYAVAKRMVPNPTQIDDLVQETYLRAFRGFPAYRGGSMRAWLVSICLNAARSEARQAARRPEETAEPDPEAHRSPCDVSSEAAAALDRVAIVTALAQLPESLRTSVVLVDLAGLTAQEAADALACPRGTVLARVHRGRRRLAILLEREGIRREL